MAGRKQREVPRDLARVRDRLAAWRRTRKPSSRIPERLWTQAVELVAEHGLHRVAATLRLDYYSLKKRVPDRDMTQPAFVELPPVMSATRECVLEYEDATGVTLRVSLKGYEAADVVLVGRSLRAVE